jgi:RNA-directed DNA polymerase
MKSNSICKKRKYNKQQLADNWNNIDWKIIDKEVGKLQRRIFVAKLSGNLGQIRRLQKILIKSKANLLYSIRRITSINRGKKTAGIDKLKYLRPADRYLLFSKMCNSNLLEWNPPPVKRVYVPKPGKSEKRPLGIPTIKDRVIQMVVKNALEPEWEAFFEHGSYGFRPARSTHDAMARLWRVISSKKRVWVLDADIKGCFNNIAHDPLLQNIQGFPGQQLVERWLKAGYFEKEQLFETDTGTPQGGIISPLLANIALHGMEKALGIKYHQDGYVGSNCPYVLVRYADDFVVLARTEGEALKAKEILSEFLSQRGMEFSPEKTNIRNLTEEGLDFLGWTFRLYKNFPGKRRIKAFKRAKGDYVTLVTPSKKSIKNIKAKIRLLFREYVSKPTGQLIDRLNPIITGWTNYHKFVNSNKAFRSLDSFIYLQAVRYAKRSHTNKSWEWLKRKYFATATYTRRTKTGRKSINLTNWAFQTEGRSLKLFKQTSLENYSSIKYNANPFNPKDKDYFLDRKLANLFKKDSFRKSIYNKQLGLCPVCRRNLVEGDWDEPMHLHHLVPRKEGGKDIIQNLIMLHEECHYAIHKENVSKEELLSNWYKAVALKEANSADSRQEIVRRMEVLRTVICDPAFPQYIRAMAAINLSKTVKEEEIPLSKQLQKKNLIAFSNIFKDKAVFQFFKNYYLKENLEGTSILPAIGTDSLSVSNCFILLEPIASRGARWVLRGGNLKWIPLPRFSAMHGSLVTSSLIRETTENESANEGYKFGQEEETYNIVAAHKDKD